MNRRLVFGSVTTALASALSIRRAGAAPAGDLDANKRLIQDLIERVWRRGRIDELPMFWTADCVNHADPAPEKRGLQALTKYHEGFTAWFRAFEEMEIDVQRQVAEGDVAVTQMLLRAVHKAKQRRISLATIRIDRVEDGKIAEHWSVADAAGLQEQLE